MKREITKKQKALADALLEIMKRDYERITTTNYSWDSYDIKQYETANEIIDLPIGGDDFACAAKVAGYSNSTINDIYNMGKSCVKIMDAIEPYVMSEWKKIIDK